MLGLAIEVRAAHRYFTSPKYAPEKKFLIIASGPRSGSTLLGELAGSLDDVTCHSEILHDKKIFRRRHVFHHYATTPTPVFGFKLLSDQCVGDPVEFLTEFADEGYKFIYVRRENYLRQAVSLYHATASEEFHTTAARKTGATWVDPAALLDSLETLRRSREGVEAFLGHTPHLEIVYERDLEPNDQHPDTLRRVSEYLGVPYGPPKTTLKKRLPTLLRGAVENYDELAGALTGTVYEVHLD